MRGRKPKPSYLAALDGGASHSRVENPDEPKPEGVLGDPPPHMTATQQKLWRDTLNNAPPGMLTDLDGSVLEGWVVAYDRHREYSELVNTLGPRVKRGNQTIMNPFIAEARRQVLVMRAFAADLGFSPTTRTRVKAKPKANRANPFNKFKSLDD